MILQNLKVHKKILDMYFFIFQKNKNWCFYKDSKSRPVWTGQCICISIYCGLVTASGFLNCIFWKNKKYVSNIFWCTFKICNIIWNPDPCKFPVTFIIITHFNSSRRARVAEFSQSDHNSFGLMSIRSEFQLED